MLDGVSAISEEKIKAENLHGMDLNDRETIFKSLLPEEQFVDRRICIYEDIDLESESDPENIDFIEQRVEVGSSIESRLRASVGSKSTYRGASARSVTSSVVHVTKQYVGELINKCAPSENN